MSIVNEYGQNQRASIHMVEQLRPKALPGHLYPILGRCPPKSVENPSVGVFGILFGIWDILVVGANLHPQRAVSPIFLSSFEHFPVLLMHAANDASAVACTSRRLESFDVVVVYYMKRYSHCAAVYMWTSQNDLCLT